MTDFSEGNERDYLHHKLLACLLAQRNSDVIVVSSVHPLGAHWAGLSAIGTFRPQERLFTSRQNTFIHVN